MAIKIYNTLTAKKEDFVPVREGEVGIYFCGMTVQDRPHLGHMRAFVVGDTIRRFFEFSGYKVNYIQNFTDIDDKIIDKSRREGIDWRKIGETYIAEYLSCSDRMNLKRATFYPRATQHIQEIIEMVTLLEKKGIAYVREGNVYFDVTKFPEYGKLSKKKLEELVSGARVEPDPLKKNPFDFALWKAWKEGEPYWHSPWGKGRPGWHIECSAMSTHYLGQPFDIHGGGEDLIFPHHENEIAQAEAAADRPFVRYWIHVGYVRLAGEKMSKSTGRFTAIKDLLERFNPNAVRLYLLQTHYRTPIEYSEENLSKAQNAWNRIEAFLSRFEGTGGKPQKVLLGGFIDAMEDDFNTPKALGVLFELVKEGNTLLDKGERDEAYQRYLAVTIILDVLGFKPEIAVSAEVDEIIEILIDVRKALREEKNYKLADMIRNRLKEKGIILEDTPQGTRWRRA